MEEQQRNIDEFFRKSLADYREAPPPAAWEDIARRLDAGSGRRKGFFTRWPWAVLSLLVFVGGAWMVLGTRTASEQPAVKLADNIQNVKESTSSEQSASNFNTQTTELKPGTNDLNAQTTKPNSEQSAKPINNITAAKVSYAGKTPAGNSEAPASEIPATSPVTDNAPSSAVAGTNPSLAKAQSDASAPSPARAQWSPKPDALPGLNAGRQHIPVPALRSTGLDAAAVSGRAMPPVPSVEKPEGDPATLAAKSARIPDPATAEMPVPQAARIWQKPASDHMSQLASEAGSRIIPQSPDASAGTPDTRILPAITVEQDPRYNLSELEGLNPQAGRFSYEASSNPTDIQSVAVARRSASDYSLPSASEEQTEAPKPDMLLPQTNFDSKFSLAAIGSYEQGINAIVQSRYNLALQLLWNIGANISIGIQPAFRFGNLTTTQLSQDALYQRSSMTIDSFHTSDISPSVRGIRDSIYNYVVRETFDSVIVKGQSIKGSFWEVELPLVARYKISKRISVFGGPSVNFGGKLTYSNSGEPVIISTNRKDSLAQSQPLPAAAFHNYFGRSSLPAYSTYKPSTDEPDPSPVRLGYVVGASYEWKHLTVEASLHQQLTGYQKMMDGVKPVYSTPYLRVGVGYIISSKKKSQPRL